MSLVKYDHFKLHPSLKDLIWIKDGKFQNYSELDNINISSNKYGINITFMGAEEPSLIYTTMEISIPSQVENVDRPSYFPTFSSLSPEQKWIYLNFLTNPYNDAFDIGYVFILFYGLERHLFLGNYDEAFKVILNLRDVHSNKSFQGYSANALILSAVLKNRGDLIEDFISSLDKDFEFNFSNNLYLLCCSSFNRKLDIKDIIRIRKDVGFLNNNYIKKYPDLFESELRNTIHTNYNSYDISIDQLVGILDFDSLHKEKLRIFTNTSISDELVDIPNLLSNEGLKNNLYKLLQDTHDSVKSKINKLKKEGTPYPETKKEEIVKEINYNQDREKELLTLFEKSNNLVDKHFILIQLQDFYYKIRSLDNKYIGLCKKYCILDIESLDKMIIENINQNIKSMQRIKSSFSKEEYDERIKQIKLEGFFGNLPAFKRLLLIYEKEKDYNKAIEVGNLALKYNQDQNYFLNKIEKLKELSKE